MNVQGFLEKLHDAFEMKATIDGEDDVDVIIDDWDSLWNALEEKFGFVVQMSDGSKFDVTVHEHKETTDIPVMVELSNDLYKYLESTSDEKECSSISECIVQLLEAEKHNHENPKSSERR